MGLDIFLCYNDTIMNLSTFNIFKTFLKIGGLTIGGGYAMIPIIEKELVHQKKWLQKEAFYRMISIAQSIPGVIALNSAIYLGYQLKGIKGAVVSALGVIMPAFFMILVLASVYSRQTLWPTYIDSFLNGIRYAVVALITVSGYKLYINTSNPYKLIIGFLVLIIILLTPIHPFILILVMAVLSYVLTKPGKKL